MVKTTLAFVQHKACLTLTFFGVSLLLLSNTIFAADPKPANAHWVCNEGYQRINDACVRMLPSQTPEVKGIATTAGSAGIFVFLAGSSLGAWYVAHAKSRKSLW